MLRWFWPVLVVVVVCRVFWLAGPSVRWGVLLRLHPLPCLLVVVVGGVVMLNVWRAWRARREG